MERLKSAVPADLRRAVGEGTTRDLPSTTSLLLTFLDGLPLFHQVISELTDPELALCSKDKGRAVELKGQGNACFSRREFQQALSFYSQALRYVPISSDVTDEILLATLYVNRASTMHKLGLLEECLRDCDRAISVSPNYAKAWYRRGMINASLKNYSSAMHDLEVALSMEATSSGKSNIEQELKLILLNHRNVNEVGRPSSDRKDAGLPHTAEPHMSVLECVSTPDKGRGMTSPNDISPASLIHVEDPLAAIILKPCRETHCHYCFSEAPADAVFCPLCTIPVYCSKKCQEQAVGGISLNQDTFIKSNSNGIDLGKLSLTSPKHKAPDSKQIAEHRHECGGAHWAAVLPADIVLAGRIMAQYIDRRMLAGKNSTISGPNLDLIHHYDIDSPTNKLESHIYAIVLLLCLKKYYRSDLSWKEETLSQLVLLICQVKVNSIAIVRMKSMDEGQGRTENKGYSAAGDAVMCSVEQVRVAQAIYMSGSFLNHSCRPNVHTYFHSRTLFLRSTEYIESGRPVELSYGPQAGKMNLPERQKSLQENYKFSCRCSSCSELHLSDLVIDSFRCPQSTCLGAVSELTYSRSKENFMHVSLQESDVCKLSLPHISNVDEDTKKVGKLFFRNDLDLKIDPGYCMSCRSQLDLASAVATSDRAASKINRFKELTVIDKVSEVFVTDALQSLEQIKKLRHPYSKALAQAEDMIAEAFAKIGDQGQAEKHCEESVKILKKLYHPKHIAIAHELIKLVSIKLSMGDMASAEATFAQAEAIFSLYYGPDALRILPYIDVLKRTVSEAP
ncbi:SET and MYND domain-containing protein 4 isoform X1 [Lolium rigidum]|uniref:SET and MYND domain-containing protein 4 isoform X1 n=1 Tax=Lolium rigidum TaxID=89674 RepID=UPI001F5DBCEA|nr:SET and MYND domain-containing protein 4 isoform X1 [Lolium rigidum]